MLGQWPRPVILCVPPPTLGLAAARHWPARSARPPPKGSLNPRDTGGASNDTRWSHDTKPCTDGYMVATLQKTTPTKKPHATHLIANYPLSIRYWCLEPESNRHARFHEAADFKSAVSTYFTIQAQGRDWRRGPESNRASRICNPVHNRFVTAPYSQQSKTVPCLKNSN